MKLTEYRVASDHYRFPPYALERFPSKRSKELAESVPIIFFFFISYG
ncbi:MAG: hypothetical protein GY703_12285 [Gammaproteobacteria bacterium]|nr:hypothetical protein [Gammaproteobacteria bacterium]